MPNKNIFCNTPWYELHIYWDGSLGICCQEDHKLYSGNQYNIATTSIAEWFNSDPVKDFRQRILKSNALTECRRCYHEEAHGSASRRIRSNQKSVIFVQAFDESFAQSPGLRHFDASGVTDTQPIDIHIDLGNYCNLACKMCNAQASSTIAVQEVRWGIESSRQYVGTDWTRNQSVWHSFKQQLLSIPKLNNIHFMGGETLLTDRFEDLVDWLIEHGRFDVCLSFVTNGTVYKPELLAKLRRFKRVGIEISIETVTDHNAYQRQGTKTAEVLDNIKRHKEWCNGSSITVTLRSAPSLLTIGYYHTLLDYALEQQLLIKSNLCCNPRFLYAINLPNNVKQQYLKKYTDLVERLNTISTNNDFNASDPNNYAMSVKQEAEMCVGLLTTAEPSDSATQLREMVNHCRRWDQIYHLDARALYPELAEIWDRYAY